MSLVLGEGQQHPGMRAQRDHRFVGLEALAQDHPGGHDPAFETRLADDRGRGRTGVLGGDQHDDVGVGQLLVQGRRRPVDAAQHQVIDRHRRAVAIGRNAVADEEAGAGPVVGRHLPRYLGCPGIQGDDSRGAGRGDRRVDPVGSLRRGGGPRAAAQEHPWGTHLIPR